MYLELYAGIVLLGRVWIEPGYAIRLVISAFPEMLAGNNTTLSEATILGRIASLPLSSIKVQVTAMITGQGMIGPGLDQVTVNAGPYMLHWFDPSEPVTESEGFVSSVPNLIVGGPAAVQATGSMQPALAVLHTDGDGDSLLNALTFDGSNDRLEVTLPVDVTTFVMMMFLVPAATAATKTLMGVASGGVAPLLQLGASSGKFNILLNPGGVVAQTVGTAISAGVAYALAVGYDGTTLRISRFTGTSTASSATANVKLASGSTFYIGGSAGKTSFNGQIADVQIWKTWAGDATALSTMLQTFYNTTLSKYYPT